MTIFAKRLDKHFAVAAAAATGVAMLAGTANARPIQYSGLVNLNIPYTTNGLYLNVQNGAYNTTGGTGATVPGWDVNPWSSSSLNYFNPTAPAGGVYVQRIGGGATANLPIGTMISATPDGGRLYGNGAAATTGNDAHVLNGGDNYIGFRFQNEANGNAIHYGWMRIRLGSSLGNSGARTLVDYAWNDVAGGGIGAGIVPAPGALALLGLAGLAGSRRRRA